MAKVFLSKLMRKILQDKDTRKQLDKAMDAGGGYIEFKGKRYKVTLK